MGRYLFSLLGVTMLSAALLAPSGAKAQEETWHGWYAGAHGGYRWADADFDSAAYQATVGGFLLGFPARSEDYDLDSPIIGLQLGFNRKRPTSNWLIGGEVDFSWGWGDDSVATNGSATEITTVTPFFGTAPFTQATTVEANWQATLRAKLGYVDGPWLYYVTAGIAWLDVEWNDTITVNIPGVGSFPFSNSDDFVLTGLALGGGVEKELNNPLWRARLEFLYENFGDENVPHGAGTPPQIGNLDIDDVYKLRIAINRKIGR